MDPLDRASRALAVSALTVACVVLGPTPQITAALERVYAVVVADDERRTHRGRDRVPRGRLPSARPWPTRPE